MKLFNMFAALLTAAALASCGGGGGSPGNTGSGGGGSSTSTVASFVLTRVGTAEAIPANGTATATLVVQALNAGNAAIPEANVALSVTGGGVLSDGLMTTDNQGRATFTVTANAADQNNRTLLVSAECASASVCTAARTSIGVQVRGATLALTPASSVTLLAGGAGTEILATVQGANNTVVSSGEVTFVSSAPGIAAVASATVPLTNGQARVMVNGLSAGNATITASAFGSSATLPINVSASDAGVSFTSPASGTVVIIGTPQALTVNAPGATSVTFATSRGVFGNGQASQVIAVGGGVAAATIQSPNSGVATVIAQDNLGRQASLELVFSPASADRIVLTAPQTSVPRASAGNEPRVLISARALLQVNGVNQPVANVPISFQLGAGPGGGERLDPPLAFTDAFGIATTTFIAGTVATSVSIPIDAQIVGTSIRTGVSPSSQPVLMNIGGSALSVAFGGSSTIQSVAENTQYVLPYSVIVTDASNNPVANQVVTLRMRPFAFSIGPACTVVRTYCSEDLNANGSLDAGEDGHRILLSNDSSTLTAGMCPPLSNQTGTEDGALTPPNSHAGTIPATVTTNGEGTATFNLTYLKAHAKWVIPIMTATVQADGTESSSSTIFRLPTSIQDDNPPTTCFLPPSPYRE